MKRSWGSLNVGPLRDELKRRKLDSTGNKSTLVSRLRGDGEHPKSNRSDLVDQARLARNDYTLQEFKLLAEFYPDHKWTTGQINGIAGPLYGKHFAYGDEGVEERTSVLFLLKCEENISDDATLAFLRFAGQCLMHETPPCVLKEEPITADDLFPAIRDLEPRTWSDWTADEVGAVVDLLKGVVSMDMSRSSPKAISVYHSFLPSWQQFLAHNPEIAIKLDS